MAHFAVVMTMAFFCHVIPWHQMHAAFRAGARPFLQHFGVHGAGVIGLGVFRFVVVFVTGVVVGVVRFFFIFLVLATAMFFF